MGLIELFKSALLGKSSGGGLAEELQKMVGSASSNEMGAGLAAAMHSDKTPPFGEMVGQLFGGSSSAQQAGMLNQLLATVGPTALSGLAGGVLGKLLAPGQTELTPEQAAQVSPQAAAELATYAESQNPGVLEQLADFYGKNSAVLNTLGAAGLAFVVAKVKENQRKA